MKIASFALGCKVNQYESEAIAEAFAASGHEIVDITDWADVYIINTCTVTNTGDKKSRQLIRRVKHQNQSAVVVVTGCYAQTATEEVAALEGVNIVVGTKGRKDLVDMVETYNPEMGQMIRVESVKLEKEFEPLSIEKLMGRTRGYLKVQDGCDRFCTYCIIPYARGPVRSRPVADVLAEVKRLAQNGFTEVVLTGIHVAAYGKDLEDMSLLTLLEAVHQVEGIARIRLSSIEPYLVTEDFAKGIAALPKVCPHFHFSLQSGCDRTLKAMHRRYTAKEYLAAVQLLRRYLPDVEFTTDIIVGFPGETEEDFAETMAFAEEVGFLKIHVFPFSPKKGTPAATMDGQLPNAVKAERSRQLGKLERILGQRRMEAYVGKTLPVLAEQEVSPGLYEGYTPNYIRVRFPAKDVQGKTVMVTLQTVEEEHMTGCR